MAKNFLDEDTKPVNKSFDYIDGFRFGFGMFVAWLIGLVMVGGLATVIIKIFRLG